VAKKETFYNNDPSQQQQQLELQQLQLQQQQLMNGQGGYLQQGVSNNGFTPVNLSVPVSGGMGMSQTIQQQSLPVQPIRPIQPVQVLRAVCFKFSKNVVFSQHFLPLQGQLWQSGQQGQ
jgi:hypothetical protein